MRNIILLSFVFSTIALLTNAQQAELTGKWQLSKVVVDDKTYENLKAVYIFEKDGVLKAARSTKSQLIEVGRWKFNKKKNSIILTSTLDKDFDGTAILVKISKTELIYKKEDAILHFKRFTLSDIAPDHKNSSFTNTIKRLDFTEEDFFNEDGDYKYSEDEDKLPWHDTYEMLMSLIKVKQLVYKFSKYDENTGAFKVKTLKADVNSNPTESRLTIDYIFNGYDRYNLPDDTDLMPNQEYSKLLYPEEENTFRVSGSEKITTIAGTFECTVVEVVGRFETCKKLWMINNKPGVYAKIIADKPGPYGQYAIYELKEIKMRP